LPRGALFEALRVLPRGALFEALRVLPRVALFEELLVRRAAGVNSSARRYLDGAGVPADSCCPTFATAVLWVSVPADPSCDPH